MATDKPRNADEHSGSIEFAGLGKGDEAPQLELHVLDRSGKVVASKTIDDRGRFELKSKKLDEGSRVLIARADRDPEQVAAAESIEFRARDFKAMLEETPTIIFGKHDWGRFIFDTQCVDGSVSRCYPYPWFINNLVLEAARAQLTTFESSPLPVRRELARIEDASIANPDLVRPFNWHCEKVCDGLVEVYRRTCCCEPRVIDPTQVLSVIHKLEAVKFKLPIWKPEPEPGPNPIAYAGLFEQGTLNEVALHADADLAQLRALSGQEQIAYIESRPRLLPLRCSCGEPEKVGHGWIHPDGTFGICWREPVRALWRDCHDEYAFVVKQSLGGETITIYNGVAAGAWFGQTSGINLVSHSARARGCGRGDPPGLGDGAFALLQDIGLTPSYKLKTPDADGWDSVAAPAYNDGLLNPAANPAAAKGREEDQNLGGTLRLRYHFSEGLEAIGAVYYRVSVTEAAPDGKPYAVTRRALNQPLSWLYYTESGSDIVVESEGLGPVVKNDTTDLYRIPYRQAGREWQSGQYHAFLPTTDRENGRHLLTLEVFDKDGKRLRPNGSTGEGIDAGFEFLRWHQETGPMAVVPYAGLTHMLWWDNRSAVALIEELLLDGSGSGEECQFISGPGDSKFSVGYRAYHPDPLFVLNHRMWWRRGLGGSLGTLERSNENAGQPPGPLATTNPSAAEPLPSTLANMLDGRQKCSFALNLRVNVKTTDGIVRLSGLDAVDQAAFALENTTS